MARLLSALVLVLALVACGESAEERYRTDFPPLNRDLAALGRDVAAGLRAAGDSDDRELAREFSRFARRLSELRDRLDELDPPGSIEREHERLRSAAGATERALGEIASAARDGDATAARAAATRLVRSGQDLDAARRNIESSAPAR